MHQIRIRPHQSRTRRICKRIFACKALKPVHYIRTRPHQTYTRRICARMFVCKALQVLRCGVDARFRRPASMSRDPSLFQKYSGLCASARLALRDAYLHHRLLAALDARCAIIGRVSGCEVASATQDKTEPKLDTLGIEPRAFRMRSGCDTSTPCALCMCGS